MLDITMVSISDIKLNPKNRNKHPAPQIERLCEIIKYQGFRRPVTISKRSGFLSCGEGRYLAAKKLKLDSIPAMYQDYESEEQEYADGIADNAIDKWAELDLTSIMNDLSNLGKDFDHNMLGIDGFTLNTENVGQCDEDAVPEHVEPKTKLGDIYTLGNHRLMCGDSTSIDAVEKLMNGEKADMVFTDPPYNIASDSKNYAQDKSKAMKDLANSEWDKNFDITPALSNMRAVGSDNLTLYVWTSQFLIQKIWDHLNDWCDFTNYCVWNKPNPMPSLSKRHPTWNTELCVYGTKGSKRKVNFPDDGHFLSCRTVTKKSDGTHPTQKPIELIEPLILFSSDHGQKVLDLFGGSGSTLIACEKTNRKCFMMELDPHYCDVIVARWEKYTGKTAVLL